MGARLETGGSGEDRSREGGCERSFVVSAASRLGAWETSRSLLRHMGEALFWAALLIAVLTRGAVTPMSLSLAAMAIGSAGCLAAIVPPPGSKARTSLIAAAALVALLVAYILFQSLSFPGNPFAHPVWTEAAGLIGPSDPAISVAPSETRNALVALATPFAFYICALALFAGDEAAQRLMAGLAAIGAAFALFGFLQVSWLRDSLLFYEKTAYLDSLTSVFVNRNTAGTFLGVASLVALSLCISRVRRVHGPRPITTLFNDARLTGYGGLLESAALVICLLAVFLTKSRGALFATAAAYLVVIPLLSAGRSSRTLERDGMPVSSKGRLVGRLALAMLLVAAVVAIFGGQAIARMEARGIDAARLCIYAASLDAFRDNWLFGTGFGTFDSVFPMYRHPDCSTPYDVFLRAHNTFLEGLVGFGIVFVPVVLFVYSHVVGNLIHGMRERRRRRHVPVVALGAVVLVTLHGIVDFSLQIPGMAAYFAAYLGAATTISLGRGGGRASSP